MGEMAQHLRGMRASGMETTTMDVGQLGERFNELLPPNFSESEFISLIVLVEAYSNEYRHDLCRPT